MGATVGLTVGEVVPGALGVLVVVGANDGLGVGNRIVGASVGCAVGDAVSVPSQREMPALKQYHPAGHSFSADAPSKTGSPCKSTE